MRSTYFLIEQTELHNFLRELDALHSWARNMAGLSTSITAQAPLGMPAARPGPHYYGIERPRRPDPFAASAWYTPSEDEYRTAPPAPRRQAFQHNHNFNQHFYGMRQGYEGFEYGEPVHMEHEVRPPPPDLERQGPSSSGMSGDQSGCAIRERRGAPGMPWQAPLKNGPHRTPVITRVPDNSHTPQRGSMFVRRPQRVRPQRNAENAEAMDDEAEDSEGDEYVEEEDDRAVGDEREAR